MWKALYDNVIKFIGSSLDCVLFIFSQNHAYSVEIPLNHVLTSTNNFLSPFLMQYSIITNSESQTSAQIGFPLKMNYWTRTSEKKIFYAICHLNLFCRRVEKEKKNEGLAREGECERWKRKLCIQFSSKTRRIFNCVTKGKFILNYLDDTAFSSLLFLEQIFFNSILFENKKKDKNEKNVWSRKL